MVLAFEEAFEIDIPDEDTEKIRTVQDAIDYIEKNANYRFGRATFGGPGWLPFVPSHSTILASLPRAGVATADS